MSLAAPAWLALLLLAAPILYLHMRRKRRAVVSSLLLWRGVAANPRPTHALHRPPVTAPLVLQLLALLLASVILARPTFGASAEHVIVLLDASSSQDAASFEAAKREAQRRIGSAAADDASRWSLVLVDSDPRPLAAAWPAGAATVADLEPLRLSGGDADWEAATRVAEELVRLGEAAPDDRSAPERASVVLIGADSPARRAAAAAIGDSEAIDVSARAGLAFSGFTVDPAPPGAPWRVRGTLEAAAGEDGAPVVIAATLIGPDGTARRGASEVELFRYVEEDAASPRWGDLALALDLGAGGEAEPSTGSDAAGEDGAGADARGRSFTLELSAGEATASAVLTPGGVRLRVLYVGPGNEPLLGALAAVDGVELTRLTPGAPLPEDLDGFGLVIADRTALPSRPATSVWWVGSASQGGVLPPAGSGAQAVGYFSATGLASRTDWPSVSFGAVWRSPTLAGAEVLVEGREGPLVQLRRTEVGVELSTPFDLAASDWPARDTFPLFVRDALRLVEPHLGAEAATSCAVGLHCPLPAGTVSVRDPDGAAVPLARWAEDGAGTIEGAFVPRRAGLHIATAAGGAERPVAVNGFSVSVQGQTDATTGMAGLRLSLRAWLVLALVLVLAAEILFASRAGGVGRWGVVLRSGTLLLAVIAATGWRAPLPAHGEKAVLLTAGGPAAEAEEGASNIGSWDAAVRYSPVEEPPTSVDLEAALDLAAALVRPGEPGRVVVRSDGLQTRGVMARAAQRAAERGIALDLVIGGTRATPDAAVRELKAPAVVLAGDRASLHADVFLSDGAPPTEGVAPSDADRTRTAAVRLLREGTTVQELSVELRPGHNRVSFELQEDSPGTFRYAVVVALPEDAALVNDRQSLSLVVEPAAEVLLVGNDDWAEIMRAALVTQGLNVTFVQPGALPTDAEALHGFGAVLLLNVPALAITTEQQAALGTAVRDLGVPLLLLGGENAFGPGGYYETPLEALSPTSSLVPREAPELAMVFVLDRSNSMRQYAGDRMRLDIAKVAALSAHELLPEGARSALIVFDSTARTLVPLGPASDDAAFRQAVEALEPRGGTNLYPALVEAYEELVDAGSAAPHVIVMSDGLSQPGDFEGILGLMSEAGVTVSTIGIGPEADAEQLREVARLGGGAFYFSGDFATLPSIMAHEVLLQTGDLTEERDTVPTWHERQRTFTSAWPDELPEVSGYVPTSLKPGATLHLSVTDEKGEVRPLLASWHHGAGEVIAFTAHAAGPWTASWLAEPSFASMWGHLVRQVSKVPERESPAWRLSRNGDVLLVEGPEPTVGLELPGGEVRQLSLRAIGGDTYGAGVLLEEAGAYRLLAGDGGSEPDALTLEVSYLGVDDPALISPERLASAVLAAGGARHAALSDVVRSPTWHLRPLPLWPLATLAALFLLLFDLTRRYAPDLLTTSRPRPALSRRRKE